MTTRQTLDAVREALQRFADYADPRGKMPATMPITSGSPMVKRQLTMGDCYAARDALAALDSRAGDAGEGFTGVEAWDELVNVDDRTSPEEYPDMCLITRNELIGFMERATPAPAVDGGEA